VPTEHAAAEPPRAAPAVGPNCPGLAQSNPDLAKYVTAAIGFPFVLLMILVSWG
jgi:hypothetical protein